MNYYELAYLISSKIDEESLKKTVEEINQFLSKEGKVLFSQTPLKKTLAYPIKKEEKAFLGSIEFEAEGEKIKGIEKMLKDKKEVLRYLIVKKKKPKEKLKIEHPTKKQKKVKISEIDQKLKEILEGNELK
jgi:ribosomal protein S6